MSKQQDNDRRDFLKTGAAVAGGALATTLFPGGVHAAGDDQIKVGIIGCGGRGTDAGRNVMSAAKNVTVVALADVFDFRINESRRLLEDFAKGKENKHENKVDVQGRTFVGLDSYKKVLDSDVNYVILASPPGFRPIHLDAAINHDKKINVFTEKPVAVDGPGIRKVMAAYEKAGEKKLCIVAGTQRRHQTGYLETMKRVHDGAIGDLVALRCYWNQNRIWFRPKRELTAKKVKPNDLAFQLHNWYHFVWTCGDHIVEQHVHNIDVCNWAMKGPPKMALSSGGRAQLPSGKPNEVGHIFDHFSTEYVYDNGVHMHSMCRQLDGCDNNFPGVNGHSEAFAGTKGVCQTNAYSLNGKPLFTRQQIQKHANPYVQEHADLIEAIRKGEQLNELKTVAESTLTAIMGRLSAYTGKMVTYKMALESKLSTMPEKLDWDAELEVPAVAVPGVTKFV